MSRAFVREADPPEPGCPGCRAPGDPVAPSTVAAHVGPADAAALGSKVYFCADPGCATAYFNGWGAAVPLAKTTGTAWPKDPSAPICPCFGFAAADVVADARARRKDRVRALRERAEGPEARCAERCPDGLPCLPRVLRLFRENLAPG